MNKKKEYLKKKEIAFNDIGVGIYDIIEGIDTHIMASWNMWGKVQDIKDLHLCKVYYNSRALAYIVVGNRRHYLKDFIRID